MTRCFFVSPPPHTQHNQILTFMLQPNHLICGKSKPSKFKAINAAQKYFLSSMLTLEMAIIWNISKCQWSLFKGLHCLEATRTTLLRIIYTLPTPQQFCHPTLRWTGTWRRNVPGRVLRWPFLSACSLLPCSSLSEEGCLKGAHEQKMLNMFYLCIN